MSPAPVQALVFDLDDTLHPEAEFVGSGLDAVARELERRGAGPAAALAARLRALQASGDRTRVLQDLASEAGFPAAWIPELVEVFRGHQPTLALAPEVLGSLAAWRARWALGCVTDGRPETQHRKSRALGLAGWLGAIVFTDAFGPGWRKPDPRPFHLACALLGADPARTVFVGDHPVRDVAGARAAGLRAVRLRRPGGYLAAEPDTVPPEATFDTWAGLARWLDGLEGGVRDAR